MTSFEITISVQFESDDQDDIDDAKKVSVDQIKEAMNNGLNEYSFDLFGESLSLLGMLTPKVTKVVKFK